MIRTSTRRVGSTGSVIVVALAVVSGSFRHFDFWFYEIMISYRMISDVNQSEKYEKDLIDLCD